MKQPRIPKGSGRSGGQFTHKSHDAPQVSLDDTCGVDDVDGRDDRMILVAVSSDNPQELQAAVESDSSVIKAVVATNPYLLDSQLVTLMRADQPDNVRIAGASQRRLATAHVAAKDPNEFVRVWTRIASEPIPTERDVEMRARRVRRLVGGELDIAEVRAEFAPTG